MTMQPDAEFQKHLMATFKLEAEEHLSGITAELIELEQAETAEQRSEKVEAVFREAHSLKGAARSVGRGDVEAVCQAMESLFSAIKRGEVQTSPEHFDLMQRAADFVARLLSMAEEERSDADKTMQRQIIRALSAAAKGEVVEAAGAKPEPIKAEGAAEPGPAGRGGPDQAVAATPELGGAATVETKAEEGARQEPETAGKAEAAGHPGTAGTAEQNAVETPSAAAMKMEAPAAAPAAPHGAAMAGAADGEAVQPTPRKSEIRAGHLSTAETVRVSWSKLSSVLLLSEEMLSAKLSARQHALQMKELRNAFAAWRKQWTRIVPELQKLSPRSTAASDQTPGHDKEIARVLEFLSWNSAFIKSLETRYASHAKDAEHDSRSLAGMVDSLLADMKKAMMFPFASLLEAFPKIVRDLSRDRGKEVDLVIKGEDIEIDRRILEEMKDPLIHLVRNSVDHGIERPEEREHKNKRRRGTVTIRIAPSDDKAEIVVSDDGAGIRPSLLRMALIKAGVLTAERAQTLTDGEVLPFIFHSGVSTSPIITDVSGHGLGLAIVKEKVEKLGGTVGVETAPDAGTTFRIVLPLSVATFRGILVRVGDRLFVLPATHVERAVRLKAEQVKSVENHDTVELGGVAVSLERLEVPLELPTPPGPPAGPMQAVLATAGEQRIAFLVDEVLGEQEVLLKGLGPQLSRVRNVAGATVLGSGKVAPILNVPDLIKSAARRGGRGAAAAAAPPGTEPSRRRKILVVEDSITSRTLLKTILESGGYDVSTAVDGLDGFTRLKGEEFDLVVSDVDMPRMNGFELTARIRKDAALGELPVVLVTALGTAEDREKGIDAGANAYIVKSSFDQSNLLEVVRRLC
jgi:two-component system, chemotaxis family, sensor kinase CheA